MGTLGVYNIQEVPMDTIATVTAAADSLAARLAPAPDTAYCRRCDSVKPLSEFYKDSHRPNGHSGQCAECRREKLQRYRATPEGKAANIESWYRSMARARERAGRTA